MPRSASSDPNRSRLATWRTEATLYQVEWAMRHVHLWGQSWFSGEDPMRLLKRLFENNERWAARMLALDPEFFERLAAQQAPQFLWIGCSDSRVPANEIIDLLPGEVFVHRNVANVVHPSDMNCLSVLQYAVETLSVRHIMVVGHYGCGGVRQALEEGGSGMIDHWLSPIRQIRRRNRAVFDSLPDERSRWDRLCEWNVIEQTVAVSQTTILRDSWARGSQIAIHGWIYDLHDGRLRDLNVTVASVAEADNLLARSNNSAS